MYVTLKNSSDGELWAKHYYEKEYGRSRSHFAHSNSDCYRDSLFYTCCNRHTGYCSNGDCRNFFAYKYYKRLSFV